MALVIRAELTEPGMQFVSLEQYNQLFTMHGTIMLFLFATPLFSGFANAIMPLQIGSPDVAFPRMNMLAYWLYLFGAIIVSLSLDHPRRRGSVRLDGVRATVRRGVLTRGRRRHVAGRADPRWSRHHPGCRQLHHDDHLPAGTRHDDVPHADLHVERACSPASWC